MLVDTSNRSSAAQSGLVDTFRARAEMNEIHVKSEKPVKAEEAKPEPAKPKPGRKPKAVKEAVPVPKPAVEPSRIPASFPAKSKPVKARMEVQKEESVTDSGSEAEAPVPKAKKVKPAAPTVAPVAPVTAPAAPAPEKTKRAKFAKGSEEAKKYMADLRARRIAKKEETAEA